jgi:hypothetical protein
MPANLRQIRFCQRWRGRTEAEADRIANVLWGLPGSNKQPGLASTSRVGAADIRGACQNEFTRPLKMSAMGQRPRMSRNDKGTPLSRSRNGEKCRPDPAQRLD